MTPDQFLGALRKWSVQVKEFPGWRTRTRPYSFDSVNGVVIHHTGSDAQSESYDEWLFTVGRPDEGIPGPLAHATIDFDGDFHLGAAGTANHAGKGSSATLSKVVNENYDGYSAEIKPGSDNTNGNTHFYGFEVKYDGDQPMTPQQYRTAVLAAAAICDFYGWSALSVIGHREWTGRKNDPGNNPMTKFRADVAAALKAGPPGAAKPVVPVDQPGAAVPGHPNPPKGPDGRYLLDASVLAAQTLNDQASLAGKPRPYRLNTVQLAQVGLNRRTLQILLGRKGVKWQSNWSTKALVQGYQTYYLGRKGSTGIADTRTCKALAKAANYYYQD
jgi:hypothetical protein